MLMTTSTRDDRVHPYHARAFVARLREAGHAATTTYYENIEGGHGGAADPKQQAFMSCLYFEFVANTIGAGLGPMRPKGPGV
jgi:prolyl oligopeptidase